MDKFKACLDYFDEKNKLRNRGGALIASWSRQKPPLFSLQLNILGLRLSLSLFFSVTDVMG